MAGERNSQGENNTDGYDYQLCTLLYCIHVFRMFRDRIKEYEIGSAIERYGALDDVVFKAVTASGKKVTYGIQVKNSKNMIDPSYLWDNPKTYVFKYFKSFLEIKKSVPLEQLEQLIIWTNMKLANNVSDWFERYDPVSQETDLLGDGSPEVSYKRYKLMVNKWKDHEQDFLQRAHPRMDLAEKFVNIMFKRNVWNSQRAAKEYYRVMAREVIDCNGDESKFKESFVTGERLSEETKLFRECFERVMKDRFKIRNYGEFSMVDLNCDSYKAYFELRIDADFKDGSRPDVEWKWTDVPNEDDVKEFFKRFVFYAEAPGLEKLKKFVGKQYGNYDQWYNLMKSCAYGTLVKDDQIEKLFKLLKLRKVMDCGPYLQLQFEDLGELEMKVQGLLNQNKSYLCVKASQNVDCTVSRLIHVLEKQLEPHSKRYLVFNYKTYNRKYFELETILKDPSFLEIGLVCLIVTYVPSDKVDEIRNKLSPLKVIFVGNDLVCGFSDQFDVGSILEDNKTKIEDTEIKLSPLQTVTAIDIFQNDLFNKENHHIVLGFYKIEQNKPVEISFNEQEIDIHYRHRLIERIDKNSKHSLCDLVADTQYHRFVICDEPGMGKSTELVRTAFALRKNYPDHLVVYLDCKSVASQWNGCMIRIVCDSLKSKNELNSLLVEKMFQMGKVILLLDGYDEVSSNNYNKLESVLCEISSNAMYRAIRLYIATRPHCLERIKELLVDCTECRLKLFSEIDQEEYLKSFWKVSNVVNTEELSLIETNTRIIINTFRAILKHNQSIIGIPLQTYMIAVIYKDRISSVDLKVPKPHEVGSIYEDFVELKFMECFKRNSDMGSVAQESRIEDDRRMFFCGHIEIARAIICGESSEELNKKYTRFQPYGLIRLLPSVGFFHQTYLEYFLTLSFILYRTPEQEDFTNFMKKHLCQSRLSIASKFLNFHISKIPKTDLRFLPSDQTNDPVSPDGFEAPSTALLHRDKMKEFHLYLKSCSTDEQYTLIRSGVKFPLLYVFEVLYDSLPNETKANLRFCFDCQKRNKVAKPDRKKKFYFSNRPDSNRINLQRVGVNQLRILLGILLKKHPNDFVRLFLSGEDDEYVDFIEVACRKNYDTVLEWLKIDLVPKLNDTERKDFEEYMKKRFKKYFELIVQHNSVSSLENTICWVREQMSVDAVQTFLLDNHIMLHFVKNIELKLKAKTEQRIEMVNLMISLYKWALGENAFTDRQCMDAINNIQNDAIRNAFNGYIL